MFQFTGPSDFGKLFGGGGGSESGGGNAAALMKLLQKPKPAYSTSPLYNQMGFGSQYKTGPAGQFTSGPYGGIDPAMLGILSNQMAAGGGKSQGPDFMGMILKSALSGIGQSVGGKSMGGFMSDLLPSLLGLFGM